MILQATIGGDYKPHPEGIYPALCVDMIELGLMPSEYMGTTRWLQKVRLVFETEQRNAEGKNWTLAKTFTASLNSKAKLAEFLGKWRGRPLAAGEVVDLDKVIGACCTLVISHQQNREGRTVASIDAVSKPTKRLVPSGGYDPVLARQRVAEWKAKLPAPPSASPKSEVRSPNPPSPGYGATSGNDGKNGMNGTSPLPSPSVPDRPSSGEGATPKSAAPVGAPAASADYDPEVGF